MVTAGGFGYLGIDPPKDYRKRLAQQLDMLEELGNSELDLQEETGS